MSMAVVRGGTAHATDPVVKCQEQKLKARGKLELCLNKNAAKVLGGKPDAAAACQTTFSDALTKAGTACRYLDNGDGTVSDLDSGLMWEKKDNLDGMANDADPHDADNTYEWSATSTAPDSNAFTDFLAKLNNGASSDGGAGTAITGCFLDHCDWRLPTIAELESIKDATQGGCNGGSGPCIDPVFGPTSVAYWSATTDSGQPSHAWELVFNQFINVLSEQKVGAVRDVRAVRNIP
jgi:hypothetical protein